MKRRDYSRVTREVKQVAMNLIALCCVVSMMFLLPGCSQEAGSTIPKKTVVHRLAVNKVISEEIPVYYTTIGTAVSDNRIQISSRIAGYIHEIPVREGQQIKKGELLVLLDGSDIDGAIEQARAAVNSARAALKDAQIDLEHYEVLFKEKSVPENALRKVRLQRDVSQEKLHAAISAFETAKSQLQYIQIKSPVNGVVVARQKRNGDLATPGIPIISIEAEEDLLFKSFVPENQIQKLAEDAQVTVVFDAIDKTVEGTISRIVPSGDPVTRSYEIKINLEDTSGLLPGMFGRVRFFTGIEISPVVGRAAVIERGGLTGVFVVDRERHAHFRWLRFGREWPARLAVQAGLSPGELIVATPGPKLHDGDLVEFGEIHE